MAYRRKQGSMSRSSTFKEEKNPPPDDGEWAAASTLAAQAIAASAAQRQSTVLSLIIYTFGIPFIFCINRSIFSYLFNRMNLIEVLIVSKHVINVGLIDEWDREVPRMTTRPWEARTKRAVFGEFLQEKPRPFLRMMTLNHALIFSIPQARRD